MEHYEAAVAGILVDVSVALVAEDCSTLVGAVGLTTHRIFVAVPVVALIAHETTTNVDDVNERVVVDEVDEVLNGLVVIGPLVICFHVSLCLIHSLCVTFASCGGIVSRALGR